MDQDNKPVPFSSPEENDPDQFLNKAKRLVLEEIVEFEHTEPGSTVEIYVVWFSKTLQNWKACLSTNQANGFYYEVTYNGDKGVAYVDSYVKVRNTPRWDDLRDLQKSTKETLEKSRDERIAENEMVANSEGMSKPDDTDKPEFRS